MHKEDIYILQTKQYYEILATLLDNCSTTCKLMNFDTMKVSIVTKNSVNTLIDGMYKKQKSTSAIGRFIKQRLLRGTKRVNRIWHFAILAFYAGGVSLL